MRAPSRAKTDPKEQEGTAWLTGRGETTHVPVGSHNLRWPEQLKVAVKDRRGPCLARTTPVPRGALQSTRRDPKFGNNNRHTPDTTATLLQNSDPFHPEQSRRYRGCRIVAPRCFKHSKTNILLHRPLRHGSTIFAGFFFKFTPR